MAKTQKVKHKGKGDKSEMLPSRHALAEITGGDVFERSIGNYAKKTPSGPNAAGPSLVFMSRFGR